MVDFDKRQDFLLISFGGKKARDNYEQRVTRREDRTCKIRGRFDRKHIIRQVICYYYIWREDARWKEIGDEQKIKMAKVKR